MSGDPRPFPFQRPLRVLIVEDNPADAELMAHALTRSGFDVSWQRVDIETDYLAQLDTYGGDAHYRLCQEVLLGMGGVRMLVALGYDAIERFHMNEGHASLLTLELLREQALRGGRDRIESTTWPS